MKKKISKVLIIALILIVVLQISSFAATDQVKLFLSSELTSSSYATDTMNYAVSTFRTLGYNIIGSNYTVASLKAPVLDYINESGNNYAFFNFSHGASNAFWFMSDRAQYIFPSEVSGNWHLVFLNHCYSLATNTQFAQAFNTIGYTNRASLGWFDEVTDGASAEWWSYFKNVAGTTNLRSACLAAADNCARYTPIRIYGDTTWTGHAW